MDPHGPSSTNLEPTTIPTLGRYLTGDYLDRLPPEARRDFEKSIEKEPEEAIPYILKSFDCQEKGRAAEAADQIAVAERFFCLCAGAMKSEFGQDLHQSWRYIQV